MPRPGSHKYDTKRAHLRKHYETDRGINDQHADEAANETLQEREEDRPEEQWRPRLASERGLGPKGERS